MLSAAIAYQVLRQENPQAIEKVKAVLEKHPGTGTNGRRGSRALPLLIIASYCFMQAARWADELRITDREHHSALWHYINWPFKPQGQPVTVQTKDPEPVNILTAMAENVSVVKNGNDPEQQAIALAWLFHLVGDVHQPLHTGCRPGCRLPPNATGKTTMHRTLRVSILGAR
jgi:hypothetical protein